MKIERQFRFTPSEAQLLNRLISHDVTHAHCIGPSFQVALPEPGILCQAVVLQTRLGALVVKPVCEDFINIEVFWLSVLPANDPAFVKGYSKLPTFQIKKEALGTLIGWKAIAATTEFERKENEPLKAHAERGLLFQFEGEKRLLITISGLPFFIHCFADSVEIDAELASMAED